MPYPIYKLIHFFGIVMSVVAIAVTCAHVLRGGTRADNPWRKTLGIAHGVGGFLIILGGFGMLARLGAGFPGWAIAKLGVLMLLGAALNMPYRSRGAAKPVLLALPLLVVLAAFFALYKPF